MQRAAAHVAVGHTRSVGRDAPSPADLVREGERLSSFHGAPGNQLLLALQQECVARLCSAPAAIPAAIEDALGLAAQLREAASRLAPLHARSPLEAAEESAALAKIAQRTKGPIGGTPSPATLERGGPLAPPLGKFTHDPVDAPEYAAMAIALFSSLEAGTAEPVADAPLLLECARVARERIIEHLPQAIAGPSDAYLADDGAPQALLHAAVLSWGCPLLPLPPCSVADLVVQIRGPVFREAFVRKEAARAGTAERHRPSKGAATPDRRKERQANDLFASVLICLVEERQAIHALTSFKARAYEAAQPLETAAILDSILIAVGDTLAERIKGTLGDNPGPARLARMILLIGYYSEEFDRIISSACPPSPPREASPSGQRCKLTQSFLEPIQQALISQICKGAPPSHPAPSGGLAEEAAAFASNQGEAAHGAAPLFLHPQLDEFAHQLRECLAAISELIPFSKSAEVADAIADAIVGRVMVMVDTFTSDLLSRKALPENEPFSVEYVLLAVRLMNLAFLVGPQRAGTTDPAAVQGLAFACEELEERLATLTVSMLLKEAGLENLKTSHEDCRATIARLLCYLASNSTGGGRGEGFQAGQPYSFLLPAVLVEAKGEIARRIAETAKEQLVSLYVDALDRLEKEPLTDDSAANDSECYLSTLPTKSQFAALISDCPR